MIKRSHLIEQSVVAELIRTIDRFLQANHSPSLVAIVVA